MSNAATQLLQEVTCETVSDRKTGKYRVEIRATETGEQLFVGPPRKTMKAARHAAIWGLVQHLSVLYAELKKLICET